MSEIIKTKFVLKKNFMRIYTLIFITIIIIICLMMLYFRISRIDFKNRNSKEIISSFIFGETEFNNNKIADINLEISEYDNFSSSSNYLIRATKEKIDIYDSVGKITFSEKVKFNNPICKNKGKYCVVADIGGKDIIVFQGKDKVYSKKIENNLLNVDISENGNVSYINESEEYHSALSLLNNKGEFVLTKGKGEGYILNSIISNDRFFSINSIDSSDIFVKTYFEFFDLLRFNDKPLKSVIRENEIFPTNFVLDNGNNIFVGNKSILNYDSNGNLIWEENFTGKIVGSTTLSGGKVVLAIKGGIKNDNLDTYSHVVIYNSMKEIVSDYKIRGDIKNLNSFDNNISVNTGREVHFLNSRGKANFIYPLKKDINSVYFLYENRVAIISRENITLLKI